MRKLMLVAAIVCAAVAAQAMNVDWDCKGSSGYYGYTVYLLTHKPSSSYENVAALAADSVSSGILSKKIGVYYVTGTLHASDASITKTAKFYLAIVASSEATSFHYIEHLAMSDYVYDQTSPGGCTSFANNIMAGAEVEFGGEVPEPTSAMLMLLGVAGLALKRKQK